MEGRIGNHGNQKESKKGQQEETLIGQLQSKPRGRVKRPLSFLAEEYKRSVSGFDRGRRNKLRNALLSFRAQDSVGAPCAMRPCFRFELPRSNFPGDFFHLYFRRIDLALTSFC